MLRRIHESRGFTLFELLVSVSIIMMIMSLGISGLTRFNRRERVKQAALTLKSNLRLMRTKSISADKPSEGCATFAGVRIRFFTNHYSMQRFCSEGVAGEETAVYLPAGVSFDPNPPDFDFTQFPLSTTIATDELDITLVSYDIGYTITITQHGSIMEKGFL